MLDSRNQRILFATLAAIILIGVLTAFSWNHETVSGGELPPRPTTSPTAVPADPTAVPNLPITGAAIQLQLSEPLPGAWTVVEWQNQQGAWFEVEGWRGHLDENGATSKTWWVYPANFGQGPFRWLLYSAEDGRQLAVSDSFELPTRNRQLLTIELALP